MTASSSMSDPAHPLPRSRRRGDDVKGYGLFYYIAEAFRGLRAHRVVNLLAVSSISMAMLLVGFFLIVFFNLHGSVTTIGKQLEMSVYLRDGLTQNEREYVYSLVKAVPGVKKVTHLSKEEALREFRKELKGQDALLKDLGENPLPESLEIAIAQRYADADRLAAMAKQFMKVPGVEDVSYGRQGVTVLTRLFRLFTYGGLAVALLLGVSVVFIVSNSVRLALYSRDKEIELMQWIGAARGFIQGPFLMEGLLLGTLGTGLAIGILTGLYYALPQELVLFLTGPKGLDFLPTEVVAYMMIGGGLLGFAGGLVTVGRLLD